MTVKYHKENLANGLTIITVPMPTQSVTGLFMVRAGSRWEQDRVAGISHFLEHMAFKGTTKRPSAMQIAEEIDAIGAEQNAFTGKEFTGYYIKAANAQLDLVIDMLSDMLQNSLFVEAEVERERGVILEEINMYEDHPSSKVGEISEELIFRGTSLGREIIGTKHTVSSMTRKDIVDYRNSWYTPSNIILVVSGGTTHNKVMKLVKKYLGNWVGSKTQKTKSTKYINQTKPALSIVNKKTEQTHMILALRTFDRFDPRRYPLLVLSSILGGGMSSRLFQEVRERRGLAYSVFSYSQSYLDAGYLGIKAGLDTKRLIQALEVIMEELRRVLNEEIPEKELTKAQEHIKGNFILSLEDSGDVANHYAVKYLLEGEIKTPQQVIDRINSVTVEDVKAVAKDIIKDKNINFAAIGPIKDRQKIAKLLQF